MKPCLLLRDGGAGLERPLPRQAKALEEDLGLGALFEAMAGDDTFLRDVSRKVLFQSLADTAAIRYRQAVLKDCLDHPDVVRRLYDLALEAVEGEKKSYFGLFMKSSPESIARRSTTVLTHFTACLAKLHALAEKEGSGFTSEGFGRFFAIILEEVTPDYLSAVRSHLKEMTFPAGVLISARLGTGNRGTGYVLRRPAEDRRGLIARLTSKGPAVFSFDISEKDERGVTALAELKGRGLNPAANALAQSADHVLSFFQALRAEVAFYLACLSLEEKLRDLGGAWVFPDPQPLEADEHAFKGLYDLSLALSLGAPVVPSDLEMGERRLAVITGANRGGKSTFLRSVGIAQLMMQCGMFVPAEAFRANVVQGLFTHFRREEDASLASGKLDEEFSRMSAIVDAIGRRSMVLMNESFAATYEREGSEIALQVTLALVEGGVKVFFVTHLHEFARRVCEETSLETLFLTAERKEDGERTFRILPGPPLATGFGKDLYEKVFGEPLA